MKAETRAILTTVFALACLGIGGGLIEPAIGFLLVGGCMWLDLTIWSLKK